MISQQTIQAVLTSADIIDIISEKVTLKKKGANHTGLCPFHEEKTGSFTVSQAKQIYKCFGCGRGGGVIQFIMEEGKKTFPEAIHLLAERYNITVEEDRQKPEHTKETKDKVQQMRQLLTWAQHQYEKSLHTLPETSPVLQYLHSRGYTTDRLQEWGIGYAPADFKFLTSGIISQNLYSIGTELGLIKTKDGNNTYDFYQNRITVPIYDHNGGLTGFAARQIPTGNKEEDSKWPKWLNPPTSLLYNKSRVWYGLNTAAKAISKEKMAYLVEGYPDVHTMQDNDLLNTVAPCGKEIADEQILFLKRYTNHVCFIPNIDENHSGQDAVLKHINKFAAHGFRLSVLPLPQCNDADEYIHHILETEKMKVA